MLLHPLIFFFYVGQKDLSDLWLIYMILIVQTYVMSDNFYNQFHCSYLTFWDCIWNLSDIFQSIPQHLFIFQLVLGINTYYYHSFSLSELQMLV